MGVHKAIRKEKIQTQERSKSFLSKKKAYLSTTSPEKPRPLSFYHDAEQRKMSTTDPLHQKAGVLFSRKAEQSYSM